MASGLAGRAFDAATKKPAKFFYPRALVRLISFMETMQPPPASFGFGPTGFGAVARAKGDTIMVAVRPLSVKVVKNTYQKPDSFHVEFDARSLPLTPKQIRACAVEISLWASPQVDTPEPQGDDGRVLLEPTIIGLVDDVTARMDESGHVVQIDGQDYTALFSGREWNSKKTPNRTSPAGLRLDLQLEHIMHEGDPTSAMRLKVEPESLRSTLPIVGAAYRRTSKKGKPVAEKSTYWDVMYRMAQQEGFIIFVEGLDVVLTLPHVLHLHRAGRLGGEPPERPVYELAYGRNLKSLELQRHLGKERTPIIAIRSYDERTRRTLEGRYPSSGETAPTGVGTERDQVHVYQMPGITQERTLKRIARTVYELIAKGEQSLACGTDDLTDANGANLLAMRSGDAMLVKVDVFNREHLLQLPEATRYTRLIAAGFPDAVARYVARNMDVVDQMEGPWRIKEVTIDYSVGEGITIDIEANEFVKIVVEE